MSLRGECRMEGAALDGGTSVGSIGDKEAGSVEAPYSSG